MLKKHNKHGPLKWIAAAAFLTAGLLVVAPVAKPVYAEDPSTTVQTSYVGFSSVSAVVENKVSVKQYGYYHISFDGNGGNGSIDPMTLVTDETEKLPANVFSRPGYTFTGWKGSDGKTYSDQQSVKNLTDQNDATITMTAQWSANTYTAKFDLNYAADTGSVPKFADGSSDSITKKTDEKLGKLPEVTRPGYKFLGWYTSAGGGSQISADTTMPAGGATYYAHWEIVNYQIRYDLDGHGHMDEAARPTHYTVEDTIKIDVPVEDSEGTVKEGNTTWYFTGWSMSGVDGYSYHLTIPKGTTGNKLLGATWSMEGYRITCKGVFGDLRGNPDPDQIEDDTYEYHYAKSGTVSSADWTTNTGHDNNAVFRQDTAITVRPDEDNIVYKIFDRVGLPVIINDMNCGPSGTLTVKMAYYDIRTGERIPDSEAEAKGFITTVTGSGTPDQTPGHYTGWSDLLGQQARAAGRNDSLAKHNVFLFPAGSYIESITFVPADSSVPVQVDPVYTRNGNTYTTTLDKLREAVHEKWPMHVYPKINFHSDSVKTVSIQTDCVAYYYNDKTHSFDYLSSESYGKVNVTWTLNGKQQTADVGTFEASIQTVPYGSTLSVDDIVPVSGSAEKTYAVRTFDLEPWSSVWNTEWPVDKGRQVTLNGGYRMVISLVENGYMVRFNANGGSGHMDNLYVDKDKGGTAPASGFHNSYADFLGWSTNPDGDSEDDVEYKAGDKLPKDLGKAGKTVELYAIWKWHETDAPANAKTFMDTNWNGVVNE